MLRNPKPDLEQASGSDLERELDLAHELPAAEVERDSGAAAAATELRSDELQRTRAERDALYDRLARLQAEFDNFRKRAQREQADFRQYALADAAKSLLPILDSLERAVHSGSGAAELRSGVELILRQFQDTLAKLGVQAVEAQGQPFDPNVHQAIEMVDRADVPDHQVIDELQRGYRIKDRLLRPAMVRVARNAKG